MSRNGEARRYCQKPTLLGGNNPHFRRSQWATDAWPPTGGPLCHPVGQAASHAELCPELSSGARRIYARGPSDYASLVSVAVPTMLSASDAVDGSSTGTEVPWMWVLLRPYDSEEPNCNRSPPAQAPLRFAILPTTAVPSWHRSLRLISSLVARTAGAWSYGALDPPAYVKPYVKRHKNDAADAANSGSWSGGEAHFDSERFRSIPRM
jgi:hypothetical protein